MPAVFSKPQPAHIYLTRHQRQQLIAALTASQLPNTLSHFPSTEYVEVINEEEADPSLVLVSKFIEYATGVAPPDAPPGSDFIVNVFTVAPGPDLADQLSADQRAELDALKAEFGDVISESSDDIGCVPPDLGITHSIPTAEAPPQVQKPYKIASYTEEK
jgi:hypothetical protein